jgi:hypothetical protein
MNTSNHPPTKNTAAQRTGSDLSGAGGLQALADALSGGGSAEAVALYLAARAEGAVPVNGAVPAFLQKSIGESAVVRLVGAFAESRCLYCRGGFSKCHTCDGSGHAEGPGEACTACMSLGASPCDFCGGSGLATYNFVPGELRPAVAMARTQMAIARAATRDQVPAGLDAPSDPRVARKRAMKELAQTSRLFGVFRNAADVARQLRKGNAASRQLTRKLFVRSTIAATRAQGRLAVLFDRLTALSVAIADAAGKENSAAFERDRAAHFEREHRRLVAAAARRTSLFPGH